MKVVKAVTVGESDVPKARQSCLAPRYPGRNPGGLFGPCDTLFRAK